MRTIPLLAIAITLAACGHDSVGPSPAPSTVSGTYDLTTVDGQVLPFRVIDLGAYQAKLVSGTLSLSEDGTYSLALGIRIEDSGNIRATSQSDAGLWSVNHDTITLTSTQANNFTWTGRVSGTTMTLQSSSPIVFGLTKHRQ